jgi:signal transduction histidine kinase
MTRRYLLALSMIGLLACSAYAAFEMVLAQHESTLAVVNISGRQRMLSQRTALFVERLAQATDEHNREYLANKLKAAVDLLEASHDGLVHGSREMGLPSEMSDTVRAMYYGGEFPLDTQMRRYIAAVRTVLATPPDELQPTMPEVRYIAFTAPGPLLGALDRMVWQYQAEGERAFTVLHRLELAVLALTLLTLTVEALVIFRPMVRQARRQIDHISGITEELRRARDHLEEQVRERTRELHAAKEAAEQANLAKSRFLAAAGHDLKQPLEAIGMFTGLLERKVENERARAVIADLRNAQGSMRVLLGALLEISRLEAGVVEPRPASVRVAPVLRQLGNEFRPLAEKKGLELRVVESTATLHTDPALLERILRNFLANAVAYTPSGGVLIGGRRSGESLRIEVHDTGVGIAEPDRRRIFEEFTQLEDPGRDRSEGIGLGLAIVDRLARLLGHPLGIRSTRGRGSMFSVTVPLASAEDA